MVKKLQVKNAFTEKPVSVHDKLLTTPQPELPEQQEEKKQPTRERLTIYLPPDVIDRAKNSAWYNRISLADLAEQAFAELLEKQEQEHGGAFPERPSKNLKAGRHTS